MMDKALANSEPAPPVHRVQALVLRASLAVSLNDHALAKHLLNDVRQMPLADHERAALTEALEKASDLEGLIGL